jgi:hypothetical protein
MLSAEPDGEAVLSSHAAPHDPQKRNPGGLSSPQAAQVWLRAAAQWPQKRCPASLT